MWAYFSPSPPVEKDGAVILPAPGKRLSMLRFWLVFGLAMSSTATRYWEKGFMLFQITVLYVNLKALINCKFLPSVLWPSPLLRNRLGAPGTCPHAMEDLWLLPQGLLRHHPPWWGGRYDGLRVGLESCLEKASIHSSYPRLPFQSDSGFETKTFKFHNLSQNLRKFESKLVFSTLYNDNSVEGVELEVVRSWKNV